MIDLKRFERLKRAVDNAKSEADRAEGAFEQQIKKMKDDFDCDSLEKAEKKAEALDKKASKAEKLYEKALKEFEEEWPDILGGNE